jgi:thiosulfate dehydrogenase
MNRDVASLLILIALLMGAGLLVACEPPAKANNTGPITRLAYTGPLISARTTMVTAWEIPKNPLTDSSLDDSKLSNDIRWGFKLFTNTPAEAPQFVPGKVSCSNCHLNAGQRDRALPIVGIAGVFPEYNRRSGRLYSLNDRVVDCFMRSQNATGDGTNVDRSLPDTTSKEVYALVAYITWLGKGYPMGKNPDWRGKNAIAADKQIPLDKLDRARGEQLFMEKCINCHGADGQGVAIGDKKAAPLWGPDSWNDGAGAARVYTLAGIIRYMMPYTYPGSLTDEEAQQISAFINSKPRPSFPFKDRDYLTDKVPPDSVYYPKR